MKTLQQLNNIKKEIRIQIDNKNQVEFYTSFNIFNNGRILQLKATIKILDNEKLIKKLRG